MRPIGLHVRITENILDAANYTRQLGLPIFQCFLINQSNRQSISIDTRLVTQFKAITDHQHLYVHGSYWLNLVQLKAGGISFLTNEIERSKQLGAGHLIIHPGAAPANMTPSQGTDAIARILNIVLARESNITFVLENTAHAYPTIGSNLTDFYHLKQKLDYPDRLQFCIDTAHAHVYGYDITNPIEQNNFIDLIDQTIGLNAIALIHLNDAAYQRGSHIDKHTVLGQGTIGLNALKEFALHPRLATIPLILELPNLPPQEDNAMVQLVRSWHL